MNRSRRQFLSRVVNGALCGVTFQRPALSRQRSQPPNASSESVVESARYLGSQFLNNLLGVTGMDGATSIVLPGDRSLWVFGDTVEEPFESIHGLDLSRLRSNTATIVPRQDVSAGIHRFKLLTAPGGKQPRQIVPFTANEDPSVHRVWAIHGICVGQRVYLFYHRITLLKGVDVFANFQLDGMGIAHADVRDLRFTRLEAPDGSLEFWKGDQPSFGVFVQQDADFVYLWGCLQTGMHLARTRPDRIDHLASYEYLVESPDARNRHVIPRWAKEFAPTAKLFDAVPNEMSASVNAHLGRHVAFHAYHREHKIVMRTAPQITGPWSDGQIVFRPERIGAGDLIYAAKEHPELSRDGGRILYLTFVNSASYVPQLVELTLK